ncbi:hypothetical protein ACJU26_08215 [Acidithiobacillus sp. M4-SHS-6]|uniref:nucleotide-binding protein n=1 Tax=Acidithiobacillus sp. M4-SHS-6 TaxID=3383024 RepID=UPI0039BE9A68
MRLIVASMKGGSGKSTVSFNLAVWLAYRVPVHLYDLDPQGTLRDVCQDRSEQEIFPALPVSTTLEGDAPNTAYTIMDTSYAALMTFRKALISADVILMPVGPSQADIWSAQRFIDVCVEWSTPPVWAFINRADTHHAVRESDDAEAALEQIPYIKPLGVRLGQRTAFRRSLSEARAVFELDAGSKASYELNEFAKSVYPTLGP